MTFDEIKASILSVAMQLELCEGYNDIVNATTEEELISSGREFIEWAYQQLIITESLINEISQIALNNNSIYNTGTFTINNPVQDVFILGNANVTVNLSDNKKHRIVVLGAGVATIHISGNSYVRIQKLQSGSDIIISLANNASCNFHAADSGIATVTAEDSSAFHAFIGDTGIISYSGSGSSVGNIKLYENAQLSYSINDDAQIFYKNFDQSTVTDGSSL